MFILKEQAKAIEMAHLLLYTRTWLGYSTTFQENVINLISRLGFYSQFPHLSSKLNMYKYSWQPNSHKTVGDIPEIWSHSVPNINIPPKKWIYPFHHCHYILPLLVSGTLTDNCVLWICFLRWNLNGSFVINWWILLSRNST